MKLLMMGAIPCIVVTDRRAVDACGRVTARMSVTRRGACGTPRAIASALTLGMQKPRSSVDPSLASSMTCCSTLRKWGTYCGWSSFLIVLCRRRPRNDWVGQGR